jgi:hypothetical protein
MFQEIQKYSVAKLKHSENRHIGAPLSSGHKRGAMGYLT